MNSEIDDKLWVKLDDGCPGPHYLLGNPHTFRGRIHGYCETKKAHFNISKNEIIEMSPESEYWIKGFLRGNEPAPPIQEDSESVDSYYSSPRYLEWMELLKKFNDTGFWGE
jgi:hypothetical protein